MDAKELLKKIKESAVSEADYEDEEDDLNTFEVPVRVIFEGTVTVKTTDQYEAETIVERYFGAIIGNCGDGGNDAIVDWDIDMHGETEIKGE